LNSPAQKDDTELESFEVRLWKS